MNKSAIKSVLVVTGGVMLAGLIMGQFWDLPVVREARAGFSG
jgi:hypothetical protein